MAAGVIFERAACRLNVFESDPIGYQVAKRIRGHVNRIRMRSLLTAGVPHNRLEWNCLAAEQKVGPGQNGRVMLQGADRRHEQMRVEPAVV